MCETYGIKHTLNSSRHPQANGLIERLNQTILPALRAATVSDESNDWDVGLKKLERDINSTVSKATGITPFEALYGFLPRFEDSKMREITEHCETYQSPTEVHAKIRDQILKEQLVYKSRCDAKRFKGVTYAVGDIVFVKRNPILTGTSTKLQSLFGGPMVIVGVLPGDTYKIRKLNEFGDRGFESTAHVSQLKIWRGSQDNEKEDFVESEASLDKDQLESESTDSEKENNDVDVNVTRNDMNVQIKNLSLKETDDSVESKRPQRKKCIPSKLRDYDCS